MKVTESRNEKSKYLHVKTTRDIVGIINAEDKTVAFSVKDELDNVASAVDLIVESFDKNGRLFFIGAGTSGRLGVMQAAECPPTFGTKHGMVQGIIAGGKESVFKAKEGAEDFEMEGRKIVEKRLAKNDILVGISANGDAPFVVGALKAAKKLGCNTIALSCNRNAKISKIAKVAIEVVVGPEVITGSTRMKAATAQKMVLDMLTTAAMVKIGRVTSNLMTNLMPTSKKLRERAIRILIEMTNLKKLDPKVAYRKAKVFLEKNHYNIKEVVEDIK